MLQELPQGNSRGFDPFKKGRDTIFLVRSGAGVYGYQNSCPHIPDSPLAWRKDHYLNASCNRIVCSGHGAEFDIASGVCALGPCVGQALTAIDLDISAVGEIFLVSKYIFETRTCAQI